MCRGFDRVLWIGPVALFMAACAWSVLDAAFSTDTWLGLAGGRQLMERLDWSRFQETFPRLDTFSYTFYGHPWFNQNWLSHLGQFWLYDRIGPSAVVYGTSIAAACIHVLVLLATYWRTESWLAAWLAAALVGIGTRDFLEPRAGVIGLLCTAALWAMICAIEGQRDRLRWWPIVPLLPLLVFWSNAHGGFVFGYGVLALYIGHWAVVRLCRANVSGIVVLVLPLLVLAYLASSDANLLFLDEPAFLRWLPLPIYVAYWARVRSGRCTAAASARQIICLAAVLIAAFVISILISPFGFENFGHPGRVTSSNIFRAVTEWHPAYSLVGEMFPPMWRFWWILGLTLGGLVLLWLTGRIAHPPAVRATRDGREAPWSLFDLAVVLIGLCMTLWARVFAPLLYVLSTPVLAVWVMRLAAPLAPHLRGYGIPALKLAAAPAAIVTGWLTVTAAHRELIEEFKDRPEVDLLERARGYATMHEAVRFVGANRLRVNLLADYGDGCSVMFYAPLARVFIDGRSQQLYTEDHFRKYWALMDGRMPPDELRRTLDITATDAVLVRRTPRYGALRSALESSPDWAPVLLNADQVLFLRHGSPGLARLGMLVREGKEWRPSRSGTITPYAQASRGLVLLNTAPADSARALDLLKEAVARELPLGRTFYPLITRLLSESFGPAAAAQYVSVQVSRVKSDVALDPQTRSALLASLLDVGRRFELPDNPPSARGDER